MTSMPTVHEHHSDTCILLHILFSGVGGVWEIGESLGRGGREEAGGEEIGFILRLINLDNREHHVSGRRGIYRSHGPMWPAVKRRLYRTHTHTHIIITGV